MTWVGHPGVVAVGKYRGKGMRLDYFMVESAIAGRIDVCEQATDGTGVGPLAERPDAAFFGSDHCAVYMRLKEEEEEVVEEEEEESVADPPPGSPTLSALAASGDESFGSTNCYYVHQR